jgi:predicted nucleotidyltransferase
VEGEVVPVAEVERRLHGAHEGRPAVRVDGMVPRVGRVEEVRDAPPDGTPLPIKGRRTKLRLMAAPLALLRQHGKEIRERFGVARIGIFGLYIRGEEKPVSDVDVLVEFRKGEKTFDHYMDLKFYLEDLFGRKVDLVMKEAIKRRLREPILSEVIYA